MRVLFLMLLLLNLSVFAWFLANRGEAPAQPGRPGSGTLTLLGESGGSGSGGCYLSDPLPREADAALVAASYGDQARVVAGEERQPIGYWVFLPPRPSFDAAREDLTRLQRAGVTDVALVTEPSMANAISLGVYGAETRAERRRASLADLGFQARVEQRYRSRMYYRVQLPHQVPPNDGDGVSWEKADCQADSA